MNQSEWNPWLIGRLLVGLQLAFFAITAQFVGATVLKAQSPNADVLITMTASPEIAVTATDFDYVISIINRGPDAAPRVIITIPMPQNTFFRAFASPPGWACTVPPVGINTTITCTDQLLPKGGPNLIVLTLTVGCALPDGTILAEEATIGSDPADPNPFLDPDPNNNLSAVSVTISNPTQISPTSRTVASIGGDGSVSVTTPSICPWTAVSNSTFLDILSGAAGTGNGSVSYSVLPNFGSTTRTAKLTIAGHTFTLTQTRFGAGNSQLNLLVPAAGANTASTTGAGSIVHTGYATVDLDSAKSPGGRGNPNAVSAPYGTAVFTVMQNGMVISEVGVPASPPTTDALIFVDYRLGAPAKSGSEDAGTIDINTGLALVNTGSSQANVSFELFRPDGNVLAFGSGILLPGTHIARFINQLSDFAKGFTLPSDFPTATQFGSLEIFSDEPVSILALRQTTNQRRESLFTTTPVADLTKSLTAGPLFFPQLADGRGFTTTLILMNPSDLSEAGTLKILDNNGLPLAIHRVGDPPGTASTFAYSIPTFGIFVLTTDGSPEVINTGSVQITPAVGTNTPAGMGIVSFAPAGVLVTESGIPSATPTTHARIYIDQSGGHNTGLALASPSSVPLEVSVTAFQSDGFIQLGSGTVDLKGNGHDAKFINELIPTLPAEFTGVLDVSSPVPFVALTLRSLTNSRGDFLLTTFPVADANMAAPVPVIFPQIADGGGFRTQFILLNTAGSTIATLNLFSDDGSDLGFTKRIQPPLR
jgi:Domain of unknown function DUF11